MPGKPGRDVTFFGRNFLPHQEPIMMSGARALISSAATNRSFADFPPVRSAEMSIPGRCRGSSARPIPRNTPLGDASSAPLVGAPRQARRRARRQDDQHDLPHRPSTRACGSCRKSRRQCRRLVEQAPHDIGLQVGEAKTKSGLSSRIFGVAAEVKAMFSAGNLRSKDVSAYRHCSAGMQHGRRNAVDKRRQSRGD